MTPAGFEPIISKGERPLGPAILYQHSQISWHFLSLNIHCFAHNSLKLLTIPHQLKSVQNIVLSYVEIQLKLPSHLAHVSQVYSSFQIVGSRFLCISLHFIFCYLPLTSHSFSVITTIIFEKPMMLSIPLLILLLCSNNKKKLLEINRIA
jgi:hypothetical protein